MKWHPFAEKFPLIQGEEWESFKASIRKTRGNTVAIIYRITTDGEKQGIDGRNRFLACEELCIKPRMEEEIIDDDEVRDYILARNVHRRHMSIELRREIVAELHDEGKSIREIAETIGTSKSTVERDLSVPHGTPEEGKKKEPKVKKATSILLCKFCARRKEIGRPIIEDCPDCRVLRNDTKKQEKVNAAREAAADPLQELYDDNENPVPAALRPAFADVQLYIDAARALETAAKQVEELEKSAGYVMGNKRLNEGESENVDRVIFSTMARTGAAKIRSMRPAIIHDNCPGDACAACKGKGFFSAGETTDEPE